MVNIKTLWMSAEFNNTVFILHQTHGPYHKCSNNTTVLGHSEFQGRCCLDDKRGELRETFPAVFYLLSMTTAVSENVEAL